jgi:hypothetical protein
VNRSELKGTFTNYDNDIFKKYDHNLKSKLAEYRNPEKQYRAQLNLLCKKDLSWGDTLGKNKHGSSILELQENAHLKISEVVENLNDIYPNIKAPSDHPPCCANINIIVPIPNVLNNAYDEFINRRKQQGTPITLNTNALNRRIEKLQKV